MRTRTPVTDSRPQNKGGKGGGGEGKEKETKLSNARMRRSLGTVGNILRAILQNKIKGNGSSKPSSKTKVGKHGHDVRRKLGEVARKYVLLGVRLRRCRLWEAAWYIRIHSIDDKMEPCKPVLSGRFLWKAMAALFFFFVSSV